LYPRYGITTKILASYPGVVTDPDPDPEVLLQWFQKQNSPPSSVTSPLPVPLALQWRRLFTNRYFYYSLMVLVWMILFVIVVVFIVVKK